MPYVVGGMSKHLDPLIGQLAKELLEEVNRVRMSCNGPAIGELVCYVCARLASRLASEITPAEFCALVCAGLQDEQKPPGKEVTTGPDPSSPT